MSEHVPRCLRAVHHVSCLFSLLSRPQMVYTDSSDRELLVSKTVEGLSISGAVVKGVRTSVMTVLFFKDGPIDILTNTENKTFRHTSVRAHRESIYYCVGYRSGRCNVWLILQSNVSLIKKRLLIIKTDYSL